MFFQRIELFDFRYPYRLGLVLLLALFLLLPGSKIDGASSQKASEDKSAGQEPVEKATVPDFPSPKGFVLLFSGNWGGHLEPCGCAEKQLGGIDRRTEVIRKIAPDRKSRLLLDAGPLVDKQNRQEQLKLVTFLRSLYKLQYDAIGLSGPEMLILREKLDMDPNVFPTLICSNMPQKQGKEFGVVELVNKTLEFKGQKLEALILAVADQAALTDNVLSKKLALRGPAESVKKILSSRGIQPDKPSKGKLVVVMMQTINGPLAEHLQQLPAIDILVIRGVLDEPELCQVHSTKAPPLVVTTGMLGKYITRFNIPPDKIDKHEQYKFSTVEIDSQYPRDPTIVSIIDEYQEMLEMENPIADEFGIERLPLEDNNHFSGNQSCGNGAVCHQEIFQTWQQFSHARAFETLKNVKRQYDPECVVCHTVGMEYETGYRSMETTPDLIGVGCEMCHGPGKNHIDNPLADYQNKFTSCEQCHNHETSPSFDQKRKEYFEKIKLWEEPRKYWE